MFIFTVKEFGRPLNDFYSENILNSLPIESLNLQQRIKFSKYKGRILNGITKAFRDLTFVKNRCLDGLASLKAFQS